MFGAGRSMEPKEPVVGHGYAVMNGVDVGG